MSETAMPPYTFRLVGGHPALDLVNTVDRDGERLVDDRLPTVESVAGWGLSAGVIDRPVAERIRRWAAADQPLAAAAHARAIETRELLHRLFAASAAGRPGVGPIADFDRMHSRVLGRRHLGAHTGGLGWQWEPVERELVEILGPVVVAAAELLTDAAELERLRQCEGRACGWLYLDRSRNGLRRWCEMRTCGAQAKSRRQYARRTGRA